MTYKSAPHSANGYRARQERNENSARYTTDCRILHDFFFFFLHGPRVASGWDGISTIGCYVTRRWMAPWNAAARRRTSLPRRRNGGVTVLRKVMSESVPCYVLRRVEKERDSAEPPCYFPERLYLATVPCHGYIPSPSHIPQVMTHAKPPRSKYSAVCAEWKEEGEKTKPTGIGCFRCCCC